MYIPTQFDEDRLPVLHQAIRTAGLANLVTNGPDGLIATPLPLLIDPDEGSLGTLYGHIARANPQWRGHNNSEALAIFMGPDTYITPSYYETKRETGKVVPTWNYITIHAHGPAEFSDDLSLLRSIVTRLTGKFEAGRAAPWAVTDAPDNFINTQMKGIVALRMPITRLQGKWKMSQNRNDLDRAGVVSGLEADGKPALAALVRGPAA